MIEIDKLLSIMTENTSIMEYDDKFVVEIASIDTRTKQTDKKYKNKPIELQYGKFSELFKKVIPHLRNAQQFGSELEKQMLEELIKFY